MWCDCNCHKCHAPLICTILWIQTRMSSRVAQLDYFRPTPWYHWAWVTGMVGTFTVSAFLEFLKVGFSLLKLKGGCVLPRSSSLWHAGPTGRFLVLHELFSAKYCSWSVIGDCRSSYCWRLACLRPFKVW